MLKTSKGTDIFQALSDFLVNNNISWEKIVGWGANNDGFLKLVKDRYDNIIGSHCIIDRQALAAKTLPFELKTHYKLL